MSTTYVTTFSKDHLELYGNRFLQSFTNFSNDPLVLYAEEFTWNNSLDFNSTIPEHIEFKKHIDYLLSKTKDKKEIARLKKALRWSYKSFAIIHALENLNTDYVIWIDGDVETVGKVPKDLAKKLCGDKLLFGYKQKIKQELHIESGFVVFNLKHPRIKKVLQMYKLGYYFKQVLDLPKPWDGFWLAHMCEIKKIGKNAILSNAPFKSIKNSFVHHVGKDKFKDLDFDKYLGRNNLTLHS